jgi:hypothetical protein
MGRTQCYRANVAYTLYGVPKGESEPSNACKGEYFINSFFTNQGIEYFAASEALDTGAASSYCTAQDNGDEGNDNGDEEQSYEHNAVLYPNANSYTTACAADGTFVQALFEGAYCSGARTEVLNSLDDLNTDLSDLECVKVYSASDEDDAWNFAYYDDDGNNGGNDARERRMDEDEDGEDNYGIYSLLAYSETCSTFEYPLSCPDPFFAKKLLDYNPLYSEDSTWQKMSWIDWWALGIFLLALVVLLSSCCCYDKPEPHRSRRKTSNIDKDNGEDDDRRGVGDRVRGMGRWIRKKVFRRK